MDLTYHIITGVLISQVSTGTPTNTLIIGAACLPDLIGVVPYYTVKTIETIKKKESFGKLVRKLSNEYPEKKAFQNLYYYMHSLAGIAFFSILYRLLFLEISLYLSLAYASHILIDIPTHSGKWAFRPLFPFSNFKIEGKDWWKNRNLSLLMWGALILLAAMLFL